MAGKKRSPAPHKPNLHKRTTERRRVILEQLQQGMKRSEIMKLHGISHMVFTSDVERILMNKSLSRETKRKIAKGAYPISKKRYQQEYKKAKARAVAEFLHEPREAKLREIKKLKKRLSRTTNMRRGNFIQARINGILSTM